MNHLAHFALAGDAYRTGSFLGDYVKGRLDGRFSQPIELGIRLHRAIDAFTDHHPVVGQSQTRFEDRFRRYSGIMTDIFYDYLLARHWSTFYEEDLCKFSKRTLKALLDDAKHLSTDSLATAKRMYQHNSMAHYGRERFVVASFEHIATRLTRPSPLADANDECFRHIGELESDFLVFYPSLIEFSRGWQDKNPC